jgi:hypothetical protein
MDSRCAYKCAYRLVSIRCFLFQFVATLIGRIYSSFQLRAARFSLSGRTFNPKDAGSIPARPIENSLHTDTVRAPDGVRSENGGQQRGLLRLRERGESDPQVAIRKEPGLVLQEKPQQGGFSRASDSNTLWVIGHVM